MSKKELWKHLEEFQAAKGKLEEDLALNKIDIATACTELQREFVSLEFVQGNKNYEVSQKNPSDGRGILFSERNSFTEELDHESVLQLRDWLNNEYEEED